MANIREIIAKQKWIFARTYAESAPHEYIIRHKANCSDEEFLALARAIEFYGQTMWFWKRPNKYLYLDGRYYWTMSTKAVNDDGDVEFNYDDESMVINRSVASEYFVSIRKKGLPK